MTTRNYIEPILPRYVRARFDKEYLVALHPIPSIIHHTDDAVYKIEPRVVAVYLPIGGHYANGDIDFEYAGIRVTT